MIFDELCVLANGDVVCSCGDPSGKLVYGNVHRDRLADVYNGHTYYALRHWQLRSEPTSWCPVVGVRCGGRVSRPEPGDRPDGRRVRTLQLEPISHCNLACPECPVTHFDDDPAYRPDRAATLPLETMLDVVDQLPDLEKILFYNFGEPFLHPRRDRLPARGARAAAAGRQLHTSTNGLALTRDRIEAIAAEALLDRIVFSIDGARDESYRRYRVGGRFDRAFASLEALADGVPPARHPRARRHRLAVHPVRVERRRRRARARARAGGAHRRPAALGRHPHARRLAPLRRGSARAARPARRRRLLGDLDLRPARGAARPRRRRRRGPLPGAPLAGARPRRRAAGRALGGRARGRERLRPRLARPRRRALPDRRPAAVGERRAASASCPRCRCRARSSAPADAARIPLDGRAPERAGPLPPSGRRRRGGRHLVLRARLGAGRDRARGERRPRPAAGAPPPPRRPPPARCSARSPRPPSSSSGPVSSRAARRPRPGSRGWPRRAGAGARRDGHGARAGGELRAARPGRAGRSVRDGLGLAPGLNHPGAQRCRAGRGRSSAPRTARG